MRKRKVITIEKNDFFDENLIKINKENEYYYFEISNEITNDLAEAVAILMKCKTHNHKIWDLEIKNINIFNIEPERCLFWLSGGYNEWTNKENYKKNWHECYLDFQEEFGLEVISILEKSKTIGEIRNGFIKNLNLSILYNFAIEKGIA